MATLRNKLNLNQELEIISKRKEGHSLKEIMNEYGIKNAKTIYDIIQRNGRDKLIANKKYNVNEEFFTIIDTEEKAYWLGFLYADGYVRMKYNRSGELRLKLGLKDRNHIELFTKSINSSHKIKDIISSVTVKGIKHISECSTLSIYNTKIVQDLYKHGCTNNKTFTIRFPNLNKDLERHFIRGYFDGDGCVYNRKNTNKLEINIISNYSFISDLLNIVGCGYIHKHGRVYTWNLYKKSDVQLFYNYLYDNSNIYLSRKKDIFEKNILI